MCVCITLDSYPGHKRCGLVHTVCTCEQLFVALSVKTMYISKHMLIQFRLLEPGISHKVRVLFVPPLTLWCRNEQAVSLAVSVTGKQVGEFDILVME